MLKLFASNEMKLVFYRCRIAVVFQYFDVGVVTWQKVLTMVTTLSFWLASQCLRCADIKS